jgi:hypothetical protein
MTTENKALIANFMEYPGDGNGLYFTPNDVSEKLVSPDELPYDTDWNWIMSVVEKIEGLNLPDEKTEDYSLNVHIEYGDCWMTRDDDDETKLLFWHHSENSGDKKGSVVNSILEFINWYNTQSK